MSTRRSGRDTGSGRSRTASMIEKRAVLKPMATASERIATAANPGLRASHFSAYLVSDSMREDTRAESPTFGPSGERCLRSLAGAGLALPHRRVGAAPGEQDVRRALFHQPAAVEHEHP